MWSKILAAFEQKIAARYAGQPAGSFAPASRTRGLFQVRRDLDLWICAPVIYGSGVTFQPLSMKTRRLIDLFVLCRMPNATLNDDCFIVEFFNQITVEQLLEFGFARAENTVVV